MKKTTIISILFLLLTLFIFVAVSPVLATVNEGIFEGISDCRTDGDCSLCDFLTMFANIARWILSVMGGLAMIYFVWAGISFIMSFGNAEKVAASKKTITGAVLGIIIIVGGWTLVNIIFLYFVGIDSDTSGVINVWDSKPWSTVSAMCDVKNKK